MTEPDLPRPPHSQLDAIKRACLCYKRGVEAMEKQDWTLAAEMFSISVEFCPDKLNFRQLLRNCVCKRYRDNKTGAGGIAQLRLTGIRNRLCRAMAAGDWPRADLLCEEGLAINPWDVFLNANLGRVARRRGILDVARFSLTFARRLEPRSYPIHFELMEVLRELEDHDEADRIQEFLDDLDRDGDGGSDE